MHGDRLCDRGQGIKRKRVSELRIGDKMDSDHHPLEVKIRGKGVRGVVKG